jgi:hypothetical protein
VFGSLRIAKDLLDEEQRLLYRAAFCAGCHALHDLCGRPASLLTNYDQTVLALVLAGLGGAGEPERRACTALPFVTVPVQPLGDAAVALLAALDLGAVRAKLIDDVEDGDAPWSKRLALRALRGPQQRARAALRRLGFPVSLLDSLPARQAEAERAPRPTIESLAGPSVELTGQVFGHAALASDRARLGGWLRAFGEALGAIVYGLDAWDDRGADLRRGRFNAWIACGIDDPRAVAGWLDRRLADAVAARGRLPLGAQGSVVDALLQTLARRHAAIRAEAPARAVARERREAGDCDCACACPCDCGDAGCCGDVSCCAESGGGTAAEGSACSVDFCCCDPLCCWWTPGGERRRSLRRARRATRTGASLAEVDLEPLVGADGVAATDLVPDGRVSVHGLTFDARAETGFIERGARVRVAAVTRGRLHVTRP